MRKRIRPVNLERKKNANVSIEKLNIKKQVEGETRVGV
jgi:hypothetical protein